MSLNTDHLQNKVEVAGHIEAVRGYWHMKISWQMPGQKKRDRKSLTTGLPVKGNKKRAESMLDDTIKEYETMLSETLLGGHNPTGPATLNQNPLFADVLEEWVQSRDPRKVVINADFSFGKKITLKTWAGYLDKVELLSATFREYEYAVKDITPEILSEYYGMKLNKGLKKSSVTKDYTVINQALDYAIGKKMITVNPNTAITLGKLDKYNAETLNADQMQFYLEFIQGDIIEIPVLFGGFYGMRRSECVGTRESQFDFRHGFFRANHTVVKVKIDGVEMYVPSDKLKTDTSNRTYPLIDYVEQRVTAKIAENKEMRKLCGNSYCNDWIGYLCVNQLGAILDPDYITTRHKKMLEKAGLPHVRFHDLRHSCVRLMMANEVPLERIKDWVGHSDIRTTVNIYGHLEYKSKKETASIIAGSLPLKMAGAANQ